MTIRKSPSSLAIVLSLFAVAALVMGQSFMGYGVDANIPFVVTSNTTINAANAQYCGGTIQAGTGSTGFFTVTVGSVTGLPTNCVVNITNGDTTTLRGKGIAGLSGSGCSTQNILWPGQTCKIGIVNGAWRVMSRPGRWRPPPTFGTLTNFYSDFTNGTDTTGATDGMAPGTSAFRSAQHCLYLLDDQLDPDALGQTQAACNMAPATTDTAIAHIAFHSFPGAQGLSALQLIGASLPISGAVSNGGLCEITVSSTTSYSANEIVSVYGVGGATGCNGTWQVTVTDGTHLTLQSTTFGGTYTPATGTVTNGSILSGTGDVALQCFFGTILRISNVFVQSNVLPLNATDGCQINLKNGNIFGGSPSGALIQPDSFGQISYDNDIGIVSGAGNAGIKATVGGRIASGGGNINFLPGVNPSFTGLGFAYADTQGQANFGGVTINLNGNTVTGPRAQANSGGLIISGTGNCNTYFPGNSNCTQSGGGNIDGNVSGANLVAASVANGSLALGAANTLKGTLNGSSNADIAVPACTGALVWTAGVGFVCNVGTGTGTVTEQKNTASGGAVTSGNCDNINSNASSPCNVAVPGGFLNVLRNNSLSAWFHGTSLTITTAGGWCAEGVWVVPTGASVTCAQATGGNNGAPYYNVTITGAASVTDVKIRFVVESLQAALLTAQNATFQMQWVNGTGGTVTPTLATKYPTAQDNWTSSTADLAATNLQACNSAAICTPAYTLAVSNSATTGYEFVVDLGNNFSTNGKTAKIIYFDARVSPGVATGLNSTPPPFEMRDPASDTAWNERFYQTTYDNGVAPGSATHVGMVGTSGTATTNVGQMGNVFRTTMRCDPTVSFWDGAGTASKLSFWNSSTWTDGNNANSPAVIPSSAGHRGFIFYNNNNANFSFHYAADCTISGG